MNIWWLTVKNLYAGRFLWISDSYQYFAGFNSGIFLIPLVITVFQSSLFSDGGTLRLFFSA